MKLKAPIFILSSERSGTNLLRSLLDNHSALYGPRAPQLLRAFEGFFHTYGLWQGEDPKTLSSDICSLVNHPFIEWGLSEEKVLESLRGKSNFIEVWDAVYALKLDQSGKSHIVCKENNLFDFAFQLKSYYPDAKFIHLYRDPRDVALSWMKVSNGFKNLSIAAIKWNQEQMKILHAKRTFGLKTYDISYEDLISDTPKVMSELLESVGLSIEEACFTTDKDKGKSVEWNSYWKNLGKEVMKDNSKKYRKELSEDDILLIETRAFEGMSMLDYSRDTNGHWEAPEQSRLQRLFARLAFKLEKPLYKNKEIKPIDGRQSDFIQTIKRIRKKQNKSK